MVDGNYSSHPKDGKVNFPIRIVWYSEDSLSVWFFLRGSITIAMVSCIPSLVVGDSFGFGSCVFFGGLTGENGQWINRNPSWVCSIFWGQLRSASWASVSGVITLEHAGTPKEHIPPHSSVSAPKNCTCGPDMLPGKRAYNGDLLTDMLASTWSGWVIILAIQINDVETHQNVCLWCVSRTYPQKIVIVHLCLYKLISSLIVV